MSDEYLDMVIVGHVDHGKSTLIGRLLYDTGSLPDSKIQELREESRMVGKEMEFAYLLDHLQEEREQNVTIDTTQIRFQTEKREYVIIDAPGHVEFTKNMVTGASQAEAAILIVDAVEGVQEQTRRHAYILHLLGLSQVIVAINKMDLVDYSEERYGEVRDEVMRFLELIGIEPPHLIPISAFDGDNVAKPSDRMPWYTGPSILEALDVFRGRESPVSRPLRYPVQDVYKFDGKRIIAGRVESGRLEAGDEVVFWPSGRESVIKTVERWRSDRQWAESGESIGITITDPHFIERGEIMTHRGATISPRSSFPATLFWMSRRPLKRGERVILKVATQEVDAVVESVEKRIDSSTMKVLEENAEELATNEVGEVVIATKSPVIVEPFSEYEITGRFVIVKEMDVSGGGIVTRL